MAPKKEPKSPKEKKERKPKKEKSDGPKRPKTGYMLWSDDNREAVKEEGFKGKEVMVELGARWKALPDDEKQPYKDQAEELKEEFKRLHG